MDDSLEKKESNASVQSVEEHESEVVESQQSQEPVEITESHEDNESLVSAAEPAAPAAPVAPAAAEEEWVEAVYDYERTPDTPELSFFVGDKMKIVRKFGSGWMEVKFLEFDSFLFHDFEFHLGGIKWIEGFHSWNLCGTLQSPIN